MHVVLHQPRTGVLAALQHYPAGCRARVVDLLISDVEHDVQAEFEKRVAGSSATESRDCTLHIVGRARNAVNELKYCWHLPRCWLLARDVEVREEERSRLFSR